MLAATFTLLMVRLSQPYQSPHGALLLLWMLGCEIRLYYTFIALSWESLDISVEEMSLLALFQALSVSVEKQALVTANHISQ